MVKRYLLLVFVSILFGNMSSFSQNSADSLKNVLKSRADKVSRMHVMLELGDEFQKTQIPDSALYWYNLIIPQNILDDSVSLDSWMIDAPDGEKYYVTVALARSGIILAQQSSIENSVRRLEVALKLSEMQDLPQLAVYCSDNLAVICAKNNQYERAVEFFENSLGHYQELNDTRGMAYCLNNLGVINANLNSLHKAAHFFEKLLALKSSSDNSSEKLEEIQNIAMLYTKLEEFERAYEFWQDALDVAKSINDINAKRTILANLGFIAYKQNEFVEAEKYYGQLLDISKRDPKDPAMELTAQTNLSIIAGALSKVNEAISGWERTYELAKSLNSIDEQLDALINLSYLHSSINESEKASEYYERYLLVGKEFADVNSLISSYISIAEIQAAIGNYVKAREYFASALELCEEHNKISEWARVNVLVAKTFQEEQRYNQALDFIQANINQAEFLGASSIAKTHQAKADILRLQMQYPEALKFYAKALDVWSNQNKKNDAITCLNAMGAISEVMGNMPEAVNHYERAFEIAQSIGNREAVAAVSNNLGVVYRQLGDIEKASQSYQEALAIYLDIDDADRASYCYNNLGIVYEISGEYGKANEYYEKSIAIKHDTKDQKGMAASLMNMGNVHRFLGDFTKAESFYDQALSISTEIHDEQGMALALGSKAALMLEQNSYSEAIDYAKKSLEIAERLDLMNLIKEANRQLAWAYNATNVPEWAEGAYINIIEMNHDDISRNFSILSESEKELYFKTISEDFDRFHSFALNRMHSNPQITRDVYNNLLKNKGLLLKSSTAMRNAILSSKNQELINDYEQWINVNQEIASLYTMPIDQRTANPEELERVANELERKLVRTSSEFSSFEQSIRVNWEEVRSSLKDNEAAIEFTHFTNMNDSTYYAALVTTSQSENPVMIKLFNESVIEPILGEFEGNSLNYINSVYGINTDLNTQLYDLIWKPIEPHLEDISTIYISPSGLLHKVSFAAISRSQNRYLIDDYSMNMVSTTARLIEESDFELTPETSLALFGGIQYSTHPDANETWSFLQGTLEEATLIESIANQHLTNVAIYADTLATENMFKTNAPQSNMLHIATHGFFYPDPQLVKHTIEEATEVGEVEFRGGSPSFGMDNFVNNKNPLMRSGLVFAGVNDYWNGAKVKVNDDGVLTALEVINIDLRQNQLVVMSACETGLGDIAGSEGVYGLQRAFKMAGSNHLIMSLWQVPDNETAEFMEVFYTNLIQQKDLNKAFESTQNSMRQKYDPYYWAAFVLLK